MLEKIRTLLYIVFLLILIWQLAFSTNSLLGKQEAMFEIDGNTYVISNMGSAGKSDPVPIKNVGSRISCDALKDITGHNIKYNENIKGTKSFISGNNLSVDCIEPFTGLAIDYLAKDHFSYSGAAPNKDVYEFYDRVALNEFKKEQLTNGGFNYITIPYTADHCEYRKGKLECEDNPNILKRKKRLKDYIDSKIKEIL